MKEELKQYPIGGYAPGYYSCTCVTCKTEFMGHKRAVRCEPCAIEMVNTKITINDKGGIETIKQETMKQTAVEWLIQNIEEDQTIKAKSMSEWNKIFDQAKAMEKEQIINSFVECWKENMPDGYECKQSAEQYYNQTYKEDKQ